MAITLIDLMTQEFDPTQYKDNYREALSELIQARLDGKETVEAPEVPSTKVVDLMNALRASVENARGGVSKRDGKAKLSAVAKKEKKKMMQK